MTEKPIGMTPGKLVTTIEAIDVYLKPGVNFVFLESEKTDLCNLWSELKSIIRRGA